MGYKKFGCGLKRWLFIHFFTAKAFKINRLDVVILDVGLIGVNDDGSIDGLNAEDIGGINQLVPNAIRYSLNV